MNDLDKKVVNTEEQNRAVNPGDAVNQEDSISQDGVVNPEVTGNVSTDSADNNTEPETLPRKEGNNTNKPEPKVPNR